MVDPGLPSGEALQVQRGDRRQPATRGFEGMGSYINYVSYLRRKGGWRKTLRPVILRGVWWGGGLGQRKREILH